MRDAIVTISKGFMGAIPSVSYLAFLKADVFTTAFQISAGFFSVAVAGATLLSLYYDIRRKRRRDAEDIRHDQEMEIYRRRHNRNHRNQ